MGRDTFNGRSKLLVSFDNAVTLVNEEGYGFDAETEDLDDLASELCDLIEDEYWQLVSSSEQGFEFQYDVDECLDENLEFEQFTQHKAIMSVGSFIEEILPYDASDEAEESPRLQSGECLVYRLVFSGNDFQLHELAIHRSHHHERLLSKRRW